jgi:hypothetical protein
MGFFFFFNAGSSMIASAAAVSARTVLSLLYDAFRHPVRAEWSAIDCVSRVAGDERLEWLEFEFEFASLGWTQSCVVLLPVCYAVSINAAVPFVLYSVCIVPERSFEHIVTPFSKLNVHGEMILVSKSH